MEIQEKEGIPIDQQRLVAVNKHLEDERSLAYYNIPKPIIINVCLRLRGGMHHFTSGRQGFQNLPFEARTPIKQILALPLKDTEHPNHLTPVQLQNFILETHDVLSTLLHEIQEVPLYHGLPDLKTILTPILNDGEDNDSDINDSDDQ